MEITAIIFIVLIIIWLIVSMTREYFKQKWYVRGYSDAYFKYDESEHPPTKSHIEEAKEEFNDQYGFHYD